ncbi:hypothetical protein Desal_1660 [Maridesulfovibrio salexigens DSM 2638]|uniref:SMODS and SLOG-associating 2TM effector domain-containing protein n=2 Tax=Maridesulfovibrio salexigens TaxID=880 RepID=C6BT18_MARSD|nr:hypothetical protein Desal_1660 [Maridesulfovibrio salexigens DSM 2638]
MISLIKIMARTKRNRFRAAVRLEREHGDITFVITVCSIGVIAFSLVPLFFAENMTATMKSLLGFFNVVLSICIICLTLLQDSKKREKKSELFRRSGLELIGVIHNAKAVLESKGVTEEKYNIIVERYIRVLTNYRVAHEDVDDMINGARFNRNFFKKILHLAWGWTYVSRYRIFFLFFCLLLLGLICYVYNISIV